jgi:hypothetical protein
MPVVTILGVSAYQAPDLARPPLKSHFQRLMSLSPFFECGQVNMFLTGMNTYEQMYKCDLIMALLVLSYHLFKTLAKVNVVCHCFHLHFFDSQFYKCPHVFWLVAFLPVIILCMPLYIYLKSTGIFFHNDF